MENRPEIYRLLPSYPQRPGNRYSVFVQDPFAVKNALGQSVHFFINNTVFNLNDVCTSINLNIYVEMILNPTSD